ncbi:hypothetical protein [Streptomyces sp. NPDC050535]|uniref:hypothetical protein n=1 Tax=Streptomyces sp. NPDC050535 TaxID=3365626 RepID=UPI0037ABEAEF
MTELPSVEELSEEQIRGRACVWCTVALELAAGIDLGARPGQFAGSGVSWFPRGCPSCVIRMIYPEQVSHASQCTACNTRGGICSKGDELRSLLRQARR